MNKEAQELFDTLLTKNIKNLTLEEKKFLKARSVYMNEDQLKRYKEVIEHDYYQEKQEENEVSAPEEVEKVTYKELMKQAKEMGLPVRVGLKREELEKMIADAKKA